jgi:hypothetical protein
LTTTGVEASRSSTSADVVCRVVANPAEAEVHHAIRRQVFVVEQHLFDGGDWDEHDEDPATLHVLGMVGNVPGGTVRSIRLATRVCGRATAWRFCRSSAGTALALRWSVCREDRRGEVVTG